MEVKLLNINEITPYENNPRKNDKAVDKVAESIKEFGFKQPIVIDKNNTIIAGHTRYKAAYKLGIESVPVIVADDLTEEQIKAYRLADNKTAEFADWDFTLLDEELKGIFDIDMSLFGFSDEEKENPYSLKTKTLDYQITGEKPTINELLNEEKTNELIEQIMQANIPKEEKDFLIKAAYRHYVFNYKNIAEYYAHANKDVQELMEKSALVIIDFNDAIKNGYVRWFENMTELREDEYSE